MEEVEKRTWNYKRIVIAVILLAGIVVGGFYSKTYIMMYKNSLEKKEVSPTPKSLGSVKGVASEEKVNVQEALKEKIEDIKKDVEGINVVDIASSSPQIQKILNDVRALEQYPKNQFQDICKKICGL